MFTAFPRARVTRAATLAACSIGLLAFTPARAADPAKTPAAPAKTAAKAAAPAKTPLLTRDELRACMSTKARLAQQREEIVKMQEQLAAEKQTLLQSGEALKEQLATLDRTNQELVEKHVEAHNARERLVEAFQASAAKFNARVEGLNAERDAYAKGCEDRRFDEKDEIAIRKGR